MTFEVVPFGTAPGNVSGNDDRNGAKIYFCASSQCISNDIIKVDAEATIKLG